MIIMEIVEFIVGAGGPHKSGCNNAQNIAFYISMPTNFGVDKIVSLCLSGNEMPYGGKISRNVK